MLYLVKPLPDAPAVSGAGMDVLTFVMLVSVLGGLAYAIFLAVSVVRAAYRGTTHLIERSGRATAAPAHAPTVGKRSEFIPEREPRPALMPDHPENVRRAILGS